MNEIKLSGAFERGIEVKQVERGEKSMELASGSLTFTTQRNGQDVNMWIDVECVGPKAQELADVPMNVGVTITGEIRRAAWKDKTTDEWKHRHFIYYKDAELIESYVAESDIPF